MVWEIPYCMQTAKMVMHCTEPCVRIYRVLVPMSAGACPGRPQDASTMAIVCVLLGVVIFLSERSIGQS